MKLICLLFLVSIVASCNKDPEYYTLETPADQIKGFFYRTYFGEREGERDCGYFYVERCSTAWWC